MARRRDPDPTDAADRVPGVQWSDIRPARCSLEATLNHPLHTGRRSAGLALLLLLAGLAHGAPAAVDAFHSHRWTVADGLPSNSLGDIARADDGYLWIASDQGLIRFDGHGFTTFDGAVIPGLASNVITTVTIGRDGTLWAGTKHSGVIRGRDGRFQVISTGEDFASRDVLQIVEDRRGTVWVLTQRGVSTVEGDTVRAVPGLASEGGRAAIASDPRDDSLWFARGDGGELRRWHDGEVTTVDLGRRISTNARWLAPTSGGTSLVAAYSGMFRVDADLVATPLDLPGLEDRGTPFCQFAAESADGRRWFATGSGLVVVEAGAQRFIATGAAVTDLAFDTAGAAWFTAGPGVYRDDHLLLDCGSTVQGFLLDDEGGAWISTEFSGLLHLRPSVFRMQKRGESIYAVRESSSGSMWVGSWRVGVSELTGRTEPIEPFLLVYSMLEWPAGTLWIGTQQGVARVVGDQWTPDPDSGRYRVATALELDDAGNVWIASEDALLRHDGTTVTRFPYDGTDLPPYAVTEIARGTDGEMWFGTAGGGVVRFRDGAFETLGTADGLPTGLIRALCVDSRGVVWAGTLGRGLVRIVPAKAQPLSASRITTIDQAGGLAQDEIDAIVEDGFQRLWLGGKRGIFRVDLAQLDAFADGAVDAVTCTSYSEADGLSHPAVNGVGHPSARRGADGRLWFCTQDGLAVVDPATLPTRPAPRPVVIERALSGREAVPVADDRIALGAGRRDLEIAFTSPDLSDPDNLRFRYRLRGLQKEWTETGARRSAYFTHLPPGRFTLELAVTRAGRPFGDQATAIELDVAPFYYETTWFRGGLAVLAAALLVLWLARRHRLHEEREQALRDLVAARTDELVREKALVERQSQQLEELNEAKSRFFANVSHEFRTPLTLTIGPLEDVIAGRAGQLPPDLEGTLQLALRNARRLLDLVNQILDIARLESGRLTVHPGHGDLAAFAREVAEGFAGWAERHEVALRLELPAEPTPFVFDPYVVERVLVNLLANAFKFTPRGGAVTLVLETDAEHARLVVRDTGPGIPTEERARIFSRFYRS
ncbi:MAG TPA: histidine kinase dimerization/phospho-acceptor domain-containing protein, partial [Candidatus Krumholzibacteria bacterium]|nr:histidine kinase dimerization/phospho-acceptor domain-containing protein [Candidatus Krumholzibacteria bacterium]